MGTAFSISSSDPSGLSEQESSHPHAILLRAWNTPPGQLALQPELVGRLHAARSKLIVPTEGTESGANTVAGIETQLANDPIVTRYLLGLEDHLNMLKNSAQVSVVPDNYPSSHGSDLAAAFRSIASKIERGERSFSWHGFRNAPALDLTVGYFGKSLIAGEGGRPMSLRAAQGKATHEKNWRLATDQDVERCGVTAERIHNHVVQLMYRAIELRVQVRPWHLARFSGIKLTE